MDDARKVAIEQFVESWNTRDLDRLLADVGEDFEFVNAPNAVEPGIRHGPEGAAVVMKKQWEGLGEDAHQKCVRFHCRDDHVVTENRVSRGMPGSTARIENKVVMRWSFDGDRVTRLEILGAGSSYQEALAKAGVETD